MAGIAVSPVSPPQRVRPNGRFRPQPIPPSGWPFRASPRRFRVAKLRVPLAVNDHPPPRRADPRPDARILRLKIVDETPRVLLVAREHVPVHRDRPLRPDLPGGV